MVHVVDVPPTLANTRVWGRGYATEAVQAFLGVYWDVVGGGGLELSEEQRWCLIACMNEKILRSANVLRKCGFVFERTQEEEQPKGRVTVCWYRLDRPGSAVQICLV